LALVGLVRPKIFELGNLVLEYGDRAVDRIELELGFSFEDRAGRFRGTRQSLHGLLALIDDVGPRVDDRRTDSKSSSDRKNADHIFSPSLLDGLAADRGSWHSPLFSSIARRFNLRSQPRELAADPGLWTCTLTWLVNPRVCSRG